MGGPGSPPRRVAHLPGLSVHSPDCPFPNHDESMCKHTAPSRLKPGRAEFPARPNVRGGAGGAGSPGGGSGPSGRCGCVGVWMGRGGGDGPRDDPRITAGPFRQRLLLDNFIGACARIFRKAETPGAFARDHQELLEMSRWDHLWLPLRQHSPPGWSGLRRHTGAGTRPSTLDAHRPPPSARAW